jgi:hypothetical protein
MVNLYPQIIRAHWSVYLLIIAIPGLLVCLSTYLSISDYENFLERGLLEANLFTYSLFFIFLYLYGSIKISFYENSLNYRYPFSRTTEVLYSEIKKVNIVVGLPTEKYEYDKVKWRGYSRLHLLDINNKELLIINLSIYDKKGLAIIINKLIQYIPNLELNNYAKELQKGNAKKFNNAFIKGYVLPRAKIFIAWAIISAIIGSLVLIFYK